MPTYPITLDAPLPRPISVGSEDLPLCCALETIADEDRVPPSTVLGMPWFSPILGSGCLDLGDGPILDLSDLGSRVANLIAAAVKAGPDATAEATNYELADLASHVERFVHDLYVVRTHDRPHDTGIRPSDPAVQLITAAGLLTRSYHLASAMAGRPTGERFVAEDIHLADGDLPEHDEGDDGAGVVGGGRLPPLSEVVQWMFATLEEAEPVDALSTHWSPLLGYIKRRLGDGRVSGLDVQLVTELSWLGLIAHTSVYPGWSDLLVRLLAAVPDDSQRGIRRRLERLDTIIAERVRDLLQPATEASWRSFSAPEADVETDVTRAEIPETAANERDRFYVAIARLIARQAAIRELLNPAASPIGGVDDDELREQWLEARTRVSDIHTSMTNEARDRAPKGRSDIGEAFDWPIPRPVAVVTSFDIELEMAFWHLGQRFVEVVPVLVKSTTSGDMPGHVVWLAALFDPEEDKVVQDHPLWTEDEHDRGLAALRAATRQWLPAVSVQGGGSSRGDWSNLPTVVRLCGSPLIEINAGDEDAIIKLVGMDEREEVQLIPALTIDEYSSLRLSAHEIYSAASPHEKLGLPPELLAGTPALPRVWVSFGAQMDDPAVRMRVFSQLSIATITESVNDVAAKSAHTGESAAGGDSADEVSSSGGPSQSRFQRVAPGLAINRRFSDADAAVMRWLGFEFAEVGAGALIEDVEHYANDHLDTVDKALRGEKLKLWLDKADGRKRINWGRATARRCDLLRERNR